MNKDSWITGIAWRFEGTPSKAEYEAFFHRPDAVLKIIREDGQMEAVIPLQVIPHSPIYSEHEFVMPKAIRAADIARWVTPKEVAILRFHLGDDSFYFVEKSLLAPMR